MNIIKINIGILTLLYAFFIFFYPPSFFNDDSLFFTRGIENFNVIDFAPHFPGYPFIIIFGKTINFFLEDSKYSLFILSSSCGIFLPLIIFLYVKMIFDEKIAFVVFILSITSPYLINLSLSMLSDSVGLFFLFFGLFLLEKNKYKLSGVILAISFFSRPAYMIFFLIGFLYLIIYKKESVKIVFIYFIVSFLFFLAFIFFNNGMLYFYEAARFIEGHFLLWGTGQNSDINWSNNIFNLSNFFYLFLLYSIFRFNKKLLLIYILSISYFIWIVYGQNPDNLRHLIPLVFMFNIIIAKDLLKFKILIIIIVLFNIFNIFTYEEKISPIDQIIKKINDKDRIIITNRNIEILRNNLENKVVDNYYEYTSAYIYNNFQTYTISTKKPQKNNYEVFYGRFIGEKTFYLSKN